MAITYDAGTNTITVTGYTEGTPCTYTDIYNADVAGGWGVVSLQGASQFAFDCKFVIGDGSTATWLADANVELLINAGVVGDWEYWTRVTSYGHLRLGQLLDANNKICGNGVYLIDNSQAVNSIFLMYQGETNAEVNIYGSIINHPYTSGGRRGAISGIHGNIYHTTFDNVNVGGYGCDINLYNILFMNLPYPSALEYIPTGTFDRIYMTEVTIAWAGAVHLYNGYSSTIKNFEVKKMNANTYAVMVDDITVDSNLVNATIPTWAINWSGTSTGKIYRQYEFDLTVTDNAGVAISGATVTLKDKDGNTVFSTTTDVNGQIATQTVSRGYYNQANGSTLQEYSPHTLTITKTGYIPITTVFTLAEKTDWTMSMHTQLSGDADVVDVKKGKTFYKDDADSKLTGILAIVVGALKRLKRKAFALGIVASPVVSYSAKPTVFKSATVNSGYKRSMVSTDVGKPVSKKVNVESFVSFPLNVSSVVHNVVRRRKHLKSRFVSIVHYPFTKEGVWKADVKRRIVLQQFVVGKRILESRPYKVFSLFKGKIKRKHRVGVKSV